MIIAVFLQTDSMAVYALQKVRGIYLARVKAKL